MGLFGDLKDGDQLVQATRQERDPGNWPHRYELRAFDLLPNLFGRATEDRRRHKLADGQETFAPIHLSDELVREEDRNLVGSDP